MRCDEARSGLWPPERPRLVGKAVREARDHVEGCEACRSYFRQDRGLLEALDRARHVEAPRAVRERVFDALARERTGAEAGPSTPEAIPSGRASWLRRWAVAAPLALAALVAGVLLLSPSSGPVSPSAADVFLEDYLRRAVAEDEIVTSDPVEVGHFLARELGLALEPLTADGLEIEGAEICLLEGRRGAMIRYSEDGRILTHYLIPVEGQDERRPSPSPDLARALEGGPAVVTWSDGRLQQALVGEGRPEALVRLVERARRGR